MRPIAPEIYGIAPERVIGSGLSLTYRENGDGGDLLTKVYLDVFDEGPAKPESIWSHIGKRPILAAGNSSGDIQMLQFANKPPRPLCAYSSGTMTQHREFDYSLGAEKSLELAKQYGWTIVSIRDDWKTVFV